MKKENLWRVLGVILVPTTTSFCVVPLSSCRSKQEKFSFEGLTFNSEKEIIKYAESKLKREVEIINSDEGLNPASGDKINDGIDSFHQIQQQLTSQLEPGHFEEERLSPSELHGNYKVADLNQTPVLERDVYRTIDGKGIVENEDTLKKSNYLNCLNSRKEGVFFRNKFYETSSDIRPQIRNNKPALNDHYFRLCAKDVDGNVCLYSPAIFVQQDEEGQLTNEQSFKPILENFLQTGSNVIYEVNTNGVKKYYSDINKVINQVQLNRNDYLYLPKNNGHSAYVFDIKKTNQHDYYGPYASHNQIGVKQIQNKELWHSVPENNTQPLTLDLHKDNAVVSEFFNLLVPDLGLSTNDLFNISYLIEETNQYTDFMAKSVPQIWKKILEVNEQLNYGQRKSILVKMPVIYTLIIENLAHEDNIKTETKNGKKVQKSEIIQRTNQYFFSIVNFLDKMIASIFPDVILQNINNKATRFSLLELFEHAENEDHYLPSYRLNAQRIKQDYPYLLEAIKVSLLAIENCVSLNGHYPYDSKLISSILKIQPDEFEKLNPIFQKIWSTFSSKTMDDFVESLSLDPYGVHPERLTAAFAEHILLTSGLRGAFGDEYRKQISELNFDPKAINSLSFFKNTPNARELIAAADGDYGLYFLLKRRPELINKFLDHTIPRENHAVSLVSTSNFFELISSAIEVAKEIIPSIDPIRNIAKKLAELTGIEQLKKITDVLSGLADGTKLSFIREVFLAFSDVSYVVGKLVNLVSDLWPGRSSTPVKKVVYHFLNSDYFIDNNQFHVLPKVEQIAYNEEFLKQILPPIKISEPRLISQIYFNEQIYPFTDEGWYKLRYEALHHALSGGEHVLGNVRLYYSLNGINEIVENLNQNPDRIDELIKAGKISNKRNDLYAKIVKLFNKKYSPELIETVKKKEYPYENIDYLTNYEQDLLNKDGTFRTRDIVIPLPSVNEYGYISWCPAVKLDFKVTENEDKTKVRFISASEKTKKTDSASEPNSTSGYQRQFNYFFKKIVNENIPHVKKINQHLYKEQFNEIDKVVSTNFDELINKKVKTVFKLKDPKTNKEIYFYDQHDAVDYLIKHHNYQKTTKTSYQVHWVYDHRTIFKNLDSFHNWVKSKIVVI